MPSLKRIEIIKETSKTVLLGLFVIIFSILIILFLGYITKYICFSFLDFKLVTFLGINIIEMNWFLQYMSFGVLGVLSIICFILSITCLLLALISCYYFLFFIGSAFKK